MKEIKKVLIANRGEIAMRIIKTLRQMNLQSVALYSSIEHEDLHVKSADEAFALGNGTLSETWLNIPLIIQIARECDADAIHPGYGFLSENAAFAKACEDAGIIFIGPRSEVIEIMGSKIEASIFARKAGIPLLPRLEGGPSKLLEQGPQLGFPLLVKAAAGGGGKGMIRIDSAEMLQQAVFSAAEQAKRYFADDKVYLEKYVQNPRHIEVQILADNHGNVVHLFERECTLQRNHQKVVEEAPSVSMSAQSKKALHQAAVNLAETVGYSSAGTVEFILDENGDFYFLEMNTRIQVEHPVSELITGVDIVKEQIQIAMGNPLPFAQQDIQINGHAIETRLYAEDPANNFRPSAGTIKKLVLPQDKHIRIDSAIEESGKVHPSFDAMIAKIITFASDRAKTIEKMQAALDNILVHGITTNLPLLSNIMQDEIYLSNQISTHSIADNLNKWAHNKDCKDSRLMGAAMFLWMERYNSKLGSGAWRMAATEKIHINGHETEVFHYPYGENGLKVKSEGEQHFFQNILVDGHKIHFSWNNSPHCVVVSYSEQNMMILADGIHYHVVLKEAVPIPKTNTVANATRLPDIKASLFGRVLRVNVAERQMVKSGEPLLVIESMKMENAILAPADHIISSINVKEGDQVSDGQILISFES
jgi:3-methylcrotonyl-CoA carboxylase alpha subunit